MSKETRALNELAVQRVRMAAEAVANNINEFGTITDGELVVSLDAAMSALSRSKPVAGVKVKDRLMALNRFSQFVDGWGDEVLGLKQHASGDYVKWSDIFHVVQSLSLPAQEPVAWQVKTSNLPDEYFSSEAEAEQWGNSAGRFDTVIVPLYALPPHKPLQEEG